MEQNLRSREKLFRMNLISLEESMPGRKECPVLEKQFNLIKEEFSEEMHTHYPHVKTYRSRPDMIILEGTNKEVELGAAKLDELIKNLKIKRLQLPTAMQYFITTSGAISKYEDLFRQCFRRPVSLEVDTDLILSSLSSDALDEAKNIIERGIYVATIQLQGAAAEPPHLDRIKETLNKAKNKANAVELRVDLRYTTGPTGTAKTDVHLVGYSENVKHLKQLLSDFQKNLDEAKEVVMLPCPEIADYFDKFLGLTGLKQPKVMLKPSHVPRPCVHISGPWCLVQETQQALKAALGSVTSDTLVLDGAGVQAYFQEEGKINKEVVESQCKVLIIEKDRQCSPSMQAVSNVKTKAVQRSMSYTKERLGTFIKSWQYKSVGRSRRRSSSTTNVINKTFSKISLDIKLADLIDEKVDVIVVPMLNKELTATQLGRSLLSKIVDKKRSNFKKMAKKCGLSPGDVLQLDDPTPLGCSSIFFVECLPWDGVGGQSALMLGEGLRKCLDLCSVQQRSSVAFPIIGHGITLNYPFQEAVHVLTKTIGQFGTSATSGCLSTVRIVIYPSFSESEARYHEVCRQANLYQEGQEIFKAVTYHLDEITVTVGGGVILQLVRGDITKETTDVVVNTTNFINFKTEVCKAVLAKAGPEVEAALKTAKVHAGEIFVTQPGNFPCKAIFHVSGKGNKENIERLVCDIIGCCETNKHKSVAIPAIGVGPGNLEPEDVAGAIFRAIRTSTSSSLFCSLSTIRIILFKTDVFLAFKEKAIQMFPSAVMSTASMPHAPQHQHPRSGTQHQNVLHADSSISQAVYQIVGLSKNDVEKAMVQMKQLHQTQFSTETIRSEDLAYFNQDDMKSIMECSFATGLDVAKEQSDQGAWKVTGRKDDIDKLKLKILARTKSILVKEVRVRDEAGLYSRVSWCIMGSDNNWERLPMKANHDLEIKDVGRGIADAQGIQWTVSLSMMKAQADGQTRTLKRLENRQDFSFPLCWDNMTADEDLKVVQLDSASAEYNTVKNEFKETADNRVIKIERLQNVHLRSAYEVQKRHISAKNWQLSQHIERNLYHGTTEECCKSIMKTGFNRRYCGQNGTTFGSGTYFARDASYSTKTTYSKPAADGSRLMLVARVLTGSYTLGRKGMKVPPPRNDQQPHDLYDSVVNELDNPTIFVVFHDDQAYPDYCITFK